MTPDAEQPDVELRLALAMRGGVSLAVWIGGACREIDALRRSSVAPPGDFWATWRARAGYSSVVVDVMSGASAGGLNGVLYAASQVYGFPYDRMRKIWLELGSTEALVRREPPYPSLFRGDDYFGRQLDEQLRKLIDERFGDDGELVPAEPPLTTGIDLSLSATYVEPIARSVPRRDTAPLVERRYASGFVFNAPPPATPWRTSHFPVTGDGAIAVAVERLALAGRTTSSFPGAFEAAAMRSSRDRRFGADPTVIDDGVTDMGGILRDRAATPLFDGAGPPVLVLDDGGILDNIPIGRALDAVAAAPADGLTDRLVVYLQPGASGSAAKDPGEGEPPLDRRRDMVSVLRGLVGTRVGDETINDDIAQLEQQNAAIGRASVIRTSTYGKLTAQTLVPTAAAQWEGYRLGRALEDARQTAQLLADPIGVLGCDPFPSTIAGKPVADDLWRSPLTVWSPAEREDLTSRLATRLTSSNAFDQVLLIGIRPLARVGSLLLELARCYERNQVEAETASRTKAQLYRFNALVDDLIGRPRTLLWVSAAVATEVVWKPEGDDVPRHLDRFVANAPGAVDDLFRFDERDARAVVDAVTEPSAVIGELARRRLRLVDDLLGGTELPADWIDIRVALLEEVLVPIAERLRALGAGAAVGEADPAYQLHRLLAMKVPLRTVLRCLEVLSYREFTDAVPGRRPLRYVRMSSENRTPIAPLFTKVLATAVHEGLWWDVANTVKDAQEGIHVTLKLAGNELANFAAFLLPQWRANDWMWGRLDAVTTLVDELVTAKGVRRMLDDHGGKVSTAIDDELLPPGHPWRPVPRDGSDQPVDHFGYVARRWRLRCDLRAIRNSTNLATLGPDVLKMTRDALIAGRQWAIVDEELRELWDPLAPPPVSGGVTVRDAVEELSFGAETRKAPELAQPLRERFNELVAATGETVIWNINSSHPLGLTLNESQGSVVRKVLGWVALVAINRLVPKATTPGGRRWPRRLLIALVVAAVVTIAVIGVVRDSVAFLIGLGIGLLVLVGVLLAIALVVVRRLWRKWRE